MKRIILAVALFIAQGLLVAGNANAAYVLGDPGYYGRIDIGGYPDVQLIYRQPVIIYPDAPTAVDDAIYLRVPPSYASHWSRYCHRYQACGRPVYFVRDVWYRDIYVPHHRHHGFDRHGPGPGFNHHDRGPGRDFDRHDRGPGPGFDRHDRGPATGHHDRGPGMGYDRRDHNASGQMNNGQDRSQGQGQGRSRDSGQGQSQGQGQGRSHNSGQGQGQGQHQRGN